MTFFFDVTFPGNPALLESIRAVSLKLVEYVGFDQRDARQIVTAIAALTENAAKAAPSRPIDIHFKRSDEHLEVSVRCDGGAVPAKPPATVAGLDKVKWTHEGTTAICHMTRRLPASDPA